VEGVDGARAREALVEAEDLHVAHCQNRPSRGRRVSQLHAIFGGQDVWSKGVYREIVVPERLVMTDSFADEKGNTVPATYYGMGGEWPLEMLITVTFEEQDGKTKLTLKHSGTEGIGQVNRDGMRQGWNESFDKLAQYLVEILKLED